MTTVPPAARLLLDKIGSVETGKSGAAGYAVIFGNRQGELKQPITTMSVSKLLDLQLAWGKEKGRSSAAGRYQIIRKTLLGLVEAGVIDFIDTFGPKQQDACGMWLLAQRGFYDFIAGKLTVAEFGNNIAKEWASFPVLTDMTGAHLKIKRGQSYYAGDGLNRALVLPSTVEELLGGLRGGPIVETTEPLFPEPPKPWWQAAWDWVTRLIFNRKE